MKIDFPVKLTETNPIVQVDDSESTINLVKIYYKQAGIIPPFLSFLDGNEFLNYLEENKTQAEKLPCLLLLDINMPTMDGFEVLEKMRSNEAFKDIPVCTMLTSSDHDLDRSRAMDLGANGYLVKPNDAKEYISFFQSLAA